MHEQPLHQSQLSSFLGPKANLSLAWLSQPLLSLLIILVSLSFILTSIDPATNQTKQTLVASCQNVDSTTNVIVSLPHYMSRGVNEINAKAIDTVIQGTSKVIDLVLIAITQIILFAIDIYKSLFLCLMDLAVHGSLTLLIEAMKEIDEFVTITFQGVRNSLQTAVEGINTGLESTLGLIDRIPGVDFDIPQIDVPNLDSLEDVTLPHSIIDGLTTLNESIPTLDELKQSIDAFISRPINDLRESINSSLSNSTLDIEQLPIPNRSTVDLCSEFDTSWVDDVAQDATKFVRISIGLVILGAVLLVALTTYMGHQRNKRFISTLNMVKSNWLSSLSPMSTPLETLSSLRLVEHHSALSHPFITNLVHKLFPYSTTSTLQSNLVDQQLYQQRRQRIKTRINWFLLYMTNTTALSLLMFGLLGIIVLQIQIWILKGPITEIAKQKAYKGSINFSQSIENSVNENILNSTRQWQIEMNERISSLETKVNADMFEWINQGTSTVNSTINEFYDGITETISHVFNGTVLQDPISGLLYCLIGSKVVALSTALTWLHDNLHLTLPRASTSSIFLSPSQTESLIQTVSNSTESNQISPTSLVDKMIDTWIKNLEQARLGFILAIGLWLIVFVCAVVGVVWDILKYRQVNQSVVKSQIDLDTDDVDYRAFEQRPCTPPLKPLHLVQMSEKEISPSKEDLQIKSSSDKLTNFATKFGSVTASLSGMGSTVRRKFTRQSSSTSSEFSGIKLHKRDPTWHRITSPVPHPMTTTLPSYSTQDPFQDPELSELQLNMLKRTETQSNSKLIRLPTTRWHLPNHLNFMNINNDQRSMISSPEYISSTSLPHLDMNQPSQPFTDKNQVVANNFIQHPRRLNPFTTPFDDIDEDDEFDFNDDKNDQRLSVAQSELDKTNPFNLETIAVAK
ncbi:plasma membrane fusion protein prm1 [Microbotryomycetes sp. JL221]|nr:plasma membrane fusion protein prm1 [Microbotryomycetes sp. JL221]